MSLDGLVAHVGQVLGDARSLYGAAPQGGGWSSTQALSAGRDGIGTAGGVVAGWGGAASSTHLAASGGRVLALDNVIGADGVTGSGFGGAADTSQSGRNGMTGVVDDTRRGVAAIAPSTGTAAGKRQLVDHLQSQLDRAKSLLKVSEQRNVLLAQLIRGGAGGYGGAGARLGGGMSPMMGGGMGGMSPVGLGGGGMPGIPNLSSLSSLLGDGRRARDRTAQPGLTLHQPVPTGPGADAFRAAIRRGLTIKGITDPVARADWEAGMMVVGDRESDFNNTAVNGEDRNAKEGNHSAGTLQLTRTTFDVYHEPGTSADRSDNVAQVCAFVNYAMDHYRVSADAISSAPCDKHRNPLQQGGLTSTGTVTDQCYQRHGKAEFLDFLKEGRPRLSLRQLHVVCDKYQTHKTLISPAGWRKTQGSHCISPQPQEILAQPG